MSIQFPTPCRKTRSDIEQRADLISSDLATISSQIQHIEATGTVTPPGCCVLRYQARGKDRIYWYYKLHATEPIFPTKSGKMSKYKHLGKGGSPTHIDALMQVTRRTLSRRITKNQGGSTSMLV